MQAIRFFGLLMLVSCAPLLGNWSFKEFDRRKKLALSGDKAEAIDRHGNHWLLISKHPLAPKQVTCTTPRGTRYERGWGDLTIYHRDEKKQNEAREEEFLQSILKLEQLLHGWDKMNQKKPKLMKNRVSDCQN